MEFKNVFNQIDSSKENRQKKELNKKANKGEEDPKFNPSRRLFLKRAAQATGVGLFSLAGGESLKKLSEIFENQKKTTDLETLPEPETPTSEQEKIIEEEAEAVYKILDFNTEEEINLDLETIERVKAHWKKEYKTNERLRTSLEKAYYEMGAWEPYLKEEFQKQGVPIKFIYLAIPESHWQLSARSRAGAVGPYQFIPATARSYGLKTGYYKGEDQNIDERKDPIKSARACASLLKDLYNASSDWDLALSGYNGGFFWRYLKQARNQGEEISYENFLSFMGEKVNTIKEELKASETEIYTIKNGDSLEKIANKFGSSIEELCQLNDIEDQNKIWVGQKIKIKSKQKNQEKIFKTKIRGLSENLNYPAKFNAIHELIQERFVQKQKAPLSFQEKQTSTKTEQTYIFKLEDENLFQLAKRWSDISYQDIVKANPHLNPKNLKGGEKILIPSKKIGGSLQTLAQNKNELQAIQKLNPEIEKVDQVLPADYKIRIPDQRFAFK